MALLELEGITKNFGGLAAVSDFNMDVNEGEIRGLIGPNGAGKTTCYNLITGVYPLTSGWCAPFRRLFSLWSLPFSRA